MQYTMSYDADAIQLQIASDFIKLTSKNWSSFEPNFSKFYSEFEVDLDADMCIDFIGIRCYFNGSDPVAWADDENRFGYKPV